MTPQETYLAYHNRMKWQRTQEGDEPPWVSSDDYMRAVFSLAAQAVELQADAERYRFWRSLFDIDSKVDQALIIEIDRAHTPEELDAAIDSVRSKT